MYICNTYFTLQGKIQGDTRFINNGAGGVELTVVSPQILLMWDGEGNIYNIDIYVFDKKYQKVVKCDEIEYVEATEAVIIVFDASCTSRESIESVQKYLTLAHKIQDD